MPKFHNLTLYRSKVIKAISGNFRWRNGGLGSPRKDGNDWRTLPGKRRNFLLKISPKIADIALESDKG